MKRSLKKLVCIQMVLGLTILGGTSVFADQSEPLELTSSSVANGAVNVAVDEQIDLVFNKNVNGSEEIIANNKNCITLVDGESNNVNIDVISTLAGKDAPDAVKNTISVKPLEKLENEKEYTLTVSTNLKANNKNQKLEAPVVIKFTTAIVSTPEEKPEQTPDETPEQKPEEKPEQSTETNKPAVENPQTGDSLSIGMSLGMIALSSAGLIGLNYKKNRK